MSLGYSPPTWLGFRHGAVKRGAGTGMELLLGLLVDGPFGPGEGVTGRVGAGLEQVASGLVRGGQGVEGRLHGGVELVDAELRHLVQDLMCELAAEATHLVDRPALVRELDDRGGAVGDGGLAGSEDVESHCFHPFWPFSRARL